MNIRTVSVNGRTGIVVGTRTNKAGDVTRGILWDDADVIGWIPAGSIDSAVSLAKR
ncbi:hypothetical protein SEA_BILLNYE_241 [Streptomyces phage BillNye]|uniref:Uncharacterized protein n=2 Tax=Wilnyevirus billnye TaxID=2560486 RepID=A0A2L1IW22_9CAUD|nr:hypothetical protein FDJ30_gp021 [Streptomyces phage BillNye]AVD99410.1 hypothetical protein SEA_BILLNYE_241 [Streptomyces phage BillNye]QBZ72493.1 hypothetical protein SEA_CIRCINUS_240 [Streptomyces phage Circinus]